MGTPAGCIEYRESQNGRLTAILRRSVAGKRYVIKLPRDVRGRGDHQAAHSGGHGRAAVRGAPANGGRSSCARGRPGPGPFGQLPRSGPERRR